MITLKNLLTNDYFTIKRKPLTLLFISLICINLTGQEKPILIFDLTNGTLDSIPTMDYDSDISSDQTNYYIGNFNSSVATLEQSPPTSNVFPESNFSYKEQASENLDITEYPIRTSVKLFKMENDTLHDLCSGSIISRKHVLTAAHCVSGINSNNLDVDSIKVSPIYDNGIFHPEFSSSWVSKVYIFRDWDIGTEDLAILELEEPLGESNGWLSIGFNNDDELLLDGVFYKFSYPATTIACIDPNEYNGDTLYYAYGTADIVTDNYIGVNNANAIPGESGSSLIKVINEEQYCSYGALSFSNNIRHNKINNWKYYAIKNIIESDLSSNDLENIQGNELLVYPNPAVNSIYLKNVPPNSIRGLHLYDHTGRSIEKLSFYNHAKGIEVTDLPRGVYYLKVTMKSSIKTVKVIKD